jgi:hypothetical protein
MRRACRSLARQHGIGPNQLFFPATVLCLMQGAVRGRRGGSAGAGLPALCSGKCANCCACSARRRWRTRSCARRWIWRSQKTMVALTLVRSGRHAIKTVADVLGMARSNLAVQAVPAVAHRRGRRPQPDATLPAEIKGDHRRPTKLRPRGVRRRASK